MLAGAVLLPHTNAQILAEPWGARDLALLVVRLAPIPVPPFAILGLICARVGAAAPTDRHASPGPCFVGSRVNQDGPNVLLAGAVIQDTLAMPQLSYVGGPWAASQYQSQCQLQLALQRLLRPPLQALLSSTLSPQFQ